MFLAIASHAPLFRAGYVQDDHVAIESNPVVARGSAAEILGSSYWKGTEGDDRSLYRPVTIGSYAIESALAGGPKAALSHAINVLLHAAVAILLLFLARAVGAGPFAALAAGALFAVLSGPTEAVANVVGRAEVLASLFTLAALLVMKRSGPWGAEAGRNPGKERLAAWGTGLLVLLGLGSKETAICALPLLVVLELLFRPRYEKRAAWAIDRLAALAPSALALVVYLVLRTRALEAFPATQTIPAMDNPLVRVDAWQRILTGLALLPRYLYMLVFPKWLANDYSGPTIPVEQGFFPAAMLGAFLLASLVLLAIAPLFPSWSPRPRSARVGSLAACLFLFPCLLTGNLLFPVGAIFAERFLYLPATGFCLGAGFLLGSLAEKKARERTVSIALGVLLVLYGGRTFLRCLEWRDDATIFTATTRVNPRSARARYAVGKETAKRVQDPKRDRELAAKALDSYDEAIALWPEYPIAFYEKGALLGQLGDLENAVAALRDSVRLSPGYASAHYNLAIALHRSSHRAEAEREARKATLWDPESARAWAELGHLRYEGGKKREAAEAYRRAIALGRTDLTPRLREVESGG